MKILITTLLTVFSFLVYSQKNSIFSDVLSKENLKVHLKTDVNYASSTADSRKEAQSANGTLGIKFANDYLFGSTSFVVHSQNDEISTDDINENKLFGTSLLLPQNSSSNISNFEIQLGAKRFFKYVDTMSFTAKLLNPIGTQISFRINNTIWQKSTISVPLTITSTSIDMTYQVLDLDILDSDEKIRLIMSIGFVSRRLGGDYGLDQNSELRKEFLGTDKLGFNGTKFTTRLEISKFYGQIDLTSFGRKDNIQGFSGDQATISLGIRADLPLPTKVK
jgi:hypothetical protein